MTRPPWRITHSAMSRSGVVAVTAIETPSNINRIALNKFFIGFLFDVVT
jgi:hypothetical protein